MKTIKQSYPPNVIKPLELLVFVFGFILFTSILNAQETKSPKIGLVLSGGGAKGLAHIGVLKVIDSLGIKIDYVAGTSMGAVIGALYASGYSAKELEIIFKKQNFNTLINDEFPRATKSLYEKESTERYAISLPFDKFKISLPSALSRGQNVYDLIYQLMLPLNHITDFEKLPIPFFCMATNIETGASLLLDKGNLAEAVTASAALPSLFQPVTINKIILIDGGVTNNFPVEELRAKGMDIIIGVDVQDGLKDITELRSAPDILMQISNFRTINAMTDKMALTDVYIKPDVSEFSIISFNEGKVIIGSGETAALKKLAELSPFKNQAGLSQKTKKNSLIDSLNIKGVSIVGNNRYTRSYIIGKLKIRPNQMMSYNAFKNGINTLIATNNFDTFRYQLEPMDAPQSYLLKGQIRESKTTTFLKLGIHYDELYKSAALVNLTKKKLLFNNDMVALDVIFGDNTRYHFDYFIDKGFYASIGLSSRYNQFNKSVNPLLALEENSPLLVGINKIDAKVSDFTNQIYIQTLFRKDFALRLGGEHKRLQITSETLINPNQKGDLAFENTDYYGVYGTLKFDSYDHPYFPKNGFYFNGDFHLYMDASSFNADFEEFSIAKADLGYAFSVGKHLALKTEANGGFKIGDNSTTSLGFALGGYGRNFINNFYSFYGYDYISLSGDSFVKAIFTLDYEIFRKHHLIVSANYANIEDGIFTTGKWLTAPNYSGYAFGYSLETFLGPLEGKYTYSPDTGNSYWFFNLGFWF